MDETLTPIRNKYNELINDKAYIDEVLKEGAERASEIVSQKMDFIRKEIGLG
jgi:tryptophanyl-tRNA synthetase